jgi:hypothetical protein
MWFGLFIYVISSLIVIIDVFNDDAFVTTDDTCEQTLMSKILFWFFINIPVLNTFFAVFIIYKLFKNKIKQFRKNRLIEKMRFIDPFGEENWND